MSSEPQYQNLEALKQIPPSAQPPDPTKLKLTPLQKRYLKATMPGDYENWIKGGFRLPKAFKVIGVVLCLMGAFFPLPFVIDNVAAADNVTFEDLAQRTPTVLGVFMLLWLLASSMLLSSLGAMILRRPLRWAYARAGYTRKNMHRFYPWEFLSFAKNQFSPRRPLNPKDLVELFNKSWGAGVHKDLYSTALHESIHAVANYQLGRNIDEFEVKGFSGFSGHIESSDGVFKGSLTLRERREEMLIHFLAPNVVLTPRGYGSSSGDAEGVYLTAAALEEDYRGASSDASIPPTVSEILDKARGKAEKLVAENLDVILALAKHVEARFLKSASLGAEPKLTIKGSEITEFIENYDGTRLSLGRYE